MPHLRWPENQAFTTSLYKIDCLLEERYQESPEYPGREQERKAREEAAKRVAGASINAVDDDDELDKCVTCSLREHLMCF